MINSRVALLIYLLVSLPFLSSLSYSGPGDHLREELGVNTFTAPSVADIFKQLDSVKPLPFEELKREFPQANNCPREQTGLIFGGLLADGFLIVECQKSNLVEELGRVLLRQARSLGVGDRVMRHSASLTELGRRGNWSGMRQELITTQGDVEKAMSGLRDQKMAHLISLGGWLRGLEIASTAVLTKYTPQRAAALEQRDLVSYFAEEVKTLPPQIAATPLFQAIRTGLEKIRTVLDGASPAKMSLTEVQQLQSTAQQLNSMIVEKE
jgi:hypothetical protein